MSRARRFVLEGSANARDVGGLPTVDGRFVRAGVLLRSANLQYLTPEAVTMLVAELGVRRIVDLRTDVEVHREGPGPMHQQDSVIIHHLSLYHDELGADGDAGVEDAVTDDAVIEDAVTEDAVIEEVNDEIVADQDRPDPSRSDGAVPDVVTPWQRGDAAVATDRVASSYLEHLRRRPDSLVAALRAIAEPDGATLVHCAAGKDRTGVVIALALAVAGVDRHAIAEDYAETGAELPAVIELLARSAIYAPDVARSHEIPRPEAAVMLHVLDGIAAEYGDVVGYLSGHGWTLEDTRRLRSRLVG